MIFYMGDVGLSIVEVEISNMYQTGWGKNDRFEESISMLPFFFQVLNATCTKQVEEEMNGKTPKF